MHVLDTAVLQMRHVRALSSIEGKSAARCPACRPCHATRRRQAGVRRQALGGQRLLLGADRWALGLRTQWHLLLVGSSAAQRTGGLGLRRMCVRVVALTIGSSWLYLAQPWAPCAVFYDVKDDMAIAR